jgi:SH3 domain-containing YSC84-like protein 1
LNVKKFDENRNGSVIAPSSNRGVRGRVLVFTSREVDVAPPMSAPGRNPAVKGQYSNQPGGYKMRNFIGLLTVIALCGTALTAGAADETRQLEKATEVLEEIMGTPDKGIPADLLQKSVCVGVVPSELKAAFIFGGTYGRGVLVCRSHGNGPWGAPSMFNLGGANVGFQIGGEATDVVFLVMNQEGVRKLLHDQVKLGAELSAAAGPVGRTAEGATDAQMRAEILSYSRARGLFAGVSLNGAILKEDKDDNERLYGQRLPAKDILLSGTVEPPTAAQPLDRLLTKYAPSGGTPVPTV